MTDTPSLKAKSTYYYNMDIIRYILALAVIVAHTNEIAGYSTPFFLSSFEAVGGFFALSGFLMYPNYIRHDNFFGYLRQRARRIMPPYILIVLLAAIFLVVASSLSAGQYYTSSGFLAYLGANLSFLNWLHPDLPGVFQGAEFSTPAVNGSLWTMKIEWCLYFSVPLFILLQRHIRRMSNISLVILVILFSIGYRVLFTSLYLKTGAELYNILSRQLMGQFSYFYCGMLVYFIKDFFTRNILFMGAGGLVLLLISRLSLFGSIILNPVAITMLVMTISLMPYTFSALHHRNNVSYEMYLFHFPIIQFGVFLGINHNNIWIEYIYVLSTTILLSVAAHYGIEKMLKKRK